MGSPRAGRCWYWLGMPATVRAFPKPSLLFLHLANLRRPRRKGHEADDGDRLPTAGLPEAVSEWLKRTTNSDRLREQNGGHECLCYERDAG